MKIGFISLVLTLLMIGADFTSMANDVQSSVFCRQVDVSLNAFQSSIEDGQHYISESSQYFPNTWEKPACSYHIVSTTIQLPDNVSFKEFYIKHILKNKLFHRNIVFHICHSLKLHNEYYTLGIGKLRC
ncbi:MAG: hypothetical protein LBL13_12685 [Bacteroidales bacterium]|jgi:hypothetical protein|nr:hypothetical protein [Bacteroidales bacterium]